MHCGDPIEARLSLPAYNRGALVRQARGVVGWDGIWRGGEMGGRGDTGRGEIRDE